MRLIDADETINTLKSLGSRDYRREKGTIADAIKMISSNVYTPTIDASPVIHREWQEIRNAYEEIEGWLCECGREVKCKEKYCPNCGAKMKQELSDLLKG